MSDSRSARQKPTRPPAISFEFFPPKSDAQAAVLDDTVARLRRFQPTLRVGHLRRRRHVAGALARHRPAHARDRVWRRPRISPAPARPATRSRETIGCFRGSGHRALRGAPRRSARRALRALSAASARLSATRRSSSETLKLAGATEVSVSAYPERHPQSADWDAEIATLKRKVDAGADRAITQFFYDNDLFEAYVERVRRAGIDIPIVPGIMPIHRFASICDFASRCGATHSGKPGAPLRRARSGPGDAPPGRGGGRGRADGGPDARAASTRSTSIR